MTGVLNREMLDDELETVSGGRIIVYRCRPIGGGWYECWPVAVIERSMSA